MKAVVSFVIVTTTLLLCGVFLYQHVPTARTPAVPATYRVLTEAHPRKVVESVMINGNKVDMEIVVNDTVQHLVRETAVRERIVEPNWMDTLRFWVVCGALVGLAVYAIATFSLWLRDKINQRPESKDAEDTKRRFDEMIRLCTAVLVTLFTTGGLNPQVSEPPPVNAVVHNPVGMPVGEAVLKNSSAVR
jgi:hypothetical protein